MAAGSWTLTTNAKTKFQDGSIVIGTDTFKLALFQSTSNIGAGSTTYAGLTNEVANGNGYTTGGASVTLALSGTTTITWTQTDVTFTASGGSIVARWAVIYEVGGGVLAYMLLDSTPADVTTADGNQVVVKGTNGVAVVTFA